MIAYARVNGEYACGWLKPHVLYVSDFYLERLKSGKKKKSAREAISHFRVDGHFHFEYAMSIYNKHREPMFYWLFPDGTPRSDCVEQAQALFDLMQMAPPEFEVV